MWYVSIMSNRDLLARITINKAYGAALACRVVLVAAAVLFVDFVMAEPLLAEPVRAKDEPKYVGDFPNPAESRRQGQIIDDGPVRHQYRDAPVSGVWIPPQSTSHKLTESQSRASRICEPSPVNMSSRNAKRFDSSRGPIGDFPLPKLNFPCEIGPAGKHALPMTASPRVMSVQAKPIGVDGAARGVGPSLLRQKVNQILRPTPIKTYSSGYVPGSASNEDKSKGLR